MNLLAGEQPAGQKLQHARVRHGEREGQRQKQPPPVGHMQHQLHQLAEGVHRGPAELVGLPARRRILDCLHNGVRHIAHEHRLEARVAAADQRQRRQEARQIGEAIEEFVLRPEQQRRPQDGSLRKHLAHAPLAFRLAACVSGFGIPVAADGRHMHQRLNARGLRGFGNRLGGIDVQRVEAIAAARRHGADQVDDGARARHRAGDILLAQHIGAPQLDLPDMPHRLEIVRAVRGAARRAYAVTEAAFGQRPHGVPAEKA